MSENDALFNTAEYMLLDERKRTSEVLDFLTDAGVDYQKANNFINGYQQMHETACEEAKRLLKSNKRVADVVNELNDEFGHTMRYATLDAIAKNEAGNLHLEKQVRDIDGNIEGRYERRKLLPVVLCAMALVNIALSLLLIAMGEPFSSVWTRVHIFTIILPIVVGGILYFKNVRDKHQIDTYRQYQKARENKTKVSEEIRPYQSQDQWMREAVKYDFLKGLINAEEGIDFLTYEGMSKVSAARFLEKLVVESRTQEVLKLTNRIKLKKGQVNRFLFFGLFFLLIGFLSRGVSIWGLGFMFFTLHEKSKIRSTKTALQDLVNRYKEEDEARKNDLSVNLETHTLGLNHMKGIDVTFRPKDGFSKRPRTRQGL